MARPVRFEVAGGRYHVINRGNYRAFVFAEDSAKAAFLSCLDEACRRAGWVVHAWCVMSNHFHLALETPKPNLIAGMQWLQGTFATRFNRFRDERGHLFQGRYKSLLVEPVRLGAVCHYIHLNPVRAHQCPAAQLPTWPWTSLRWLHHPAARPPWYSPLESLTAAGRLPDNDAGHGQYARYLEWLSEDEPARQLLLFDRMSRGWAFGTPEFKADLVAQLEPQPGQHPAGTDCTDYLLHRTLDGWLKRMRRSRADLEADGKSARWKIELAAAMKAHSTATNRWLADNLVMGNPGELSKKIHVWRRNADAAALERLGLPPHPNAVPAATSLADGQPRETHALG